MPKFATMREAMRVASLRSFSAPVDTVFSTHELGRVASQARTRRRAASSPSSMRWRSSPEDFCWVAPRLMPRGMMLMRWAARRGRRTARRRRGPTRGRRRAQTRWGRGASLADSPSTILSNAPAKSAPSMLSRPARVAARAAPLTRFARSAPEKPAVFSASASRFTSVASGVDLVDEDDRGRALLGLAEEVAHARGAEAHEQLDELEPLIEKKGTPTHPRRPGRGASSPCRADRRAARRAAPCRPAAESAPAP